MQTITLVWLIVPFAGLLFLMAATELVASFRSSNFLRKAGLDLENLASEAPSAKSGIVGKTAQIANKITSPKTEETMAAAPKLRFYDPERDLREISAEFSGHLSRVRAISGLLIILGLLITLINLRGAVDRMKDAMEPVSSSNPSTTTTEPSGQEVPEKLGTGIQGIAASAGTAFAFSAVSISFAALILFAAVLVQKHAAGSLSLFTRKVYEQLEKSLSVDSEESNDATFKLAAAADVLSRVAIQFEKTNNALAELKGFGETLDNAAHEIKTAVGGLPAQIDGSMAKISTEVAAGIRSGLDHQAEYLRSLVAIYSDHAVILAKVSDFLTQVAQDHKSSSEALVKLVSLPSDLQALINSIKTNSSTSSTLNSTVADLSSKVAKLPAAELARTAEELTAASTRLLALETEISQVRQHAETVFSSLVEKASKEQTTRVVDMLEQLKAQVQVLNTYAQNDTAATKKSIDTIEQIKKQMNQFAATGNGSGLPPDVALLIKGLSKQIERMPWFMFLRMVKPGKEAAKKSAGRS